jgi:DNA repair exonuclease SbcCD ATPase subunit
VQRSSPDERVRDALRSGVARAQEQLGEAVVLRAADPLSLDGITELGRSLGAIRDALVAVAAQRSAMTSLTAGAGEAVAAATNAVNRAAQAAQQATAEAPATVQLATAAIDLLGDSCPVCGQPIDAADVRRHLKEVIEQSAQVAAAASAAQRELLGARAALVDAQRTAVLRAETETQLNAARTRLNVAVADAQSIAELDDTIGTDVLVERLGAALETMRALYLEALELAGARLEGLRAQADALEQEVTEAAQRVENFDRRIEASKRVEHAAHEAARRIVERALDTLQPSFAEVFDRLRPNPAFTQLDVRQDIMNNRNQVVPVVRDVERGIEANPAIVFSEGQLNVVALSYFLGMALNAREAALPFLIMDDPLQALDVIAILGFGDLARRVRNERQLIVTTHDRRFADVLVRKLSPRSDDESLIVHDFAGWTREGPAITTTVPEPAEVIPLLRRAAS